MKIPPSPCVHPPLVLRSKHQILPAAVGRGLFSEECPCKLSVCPGAPSLSGWPPSCSVPAAPLYPLLVKVPPLLRSLLSLPLPPRCPPFGGALDRLEPEANCLILASGGEYYRFELNGVDVSGLIPGDPVTVTYTGALDLEGGLRLPPFCSPSPKTHFNPRRPHPQMGYGRRSHHYLRFRRAGPPAGSPSKITRKPSRSSRSISF